MKVCIQNRAAVQNPDVHVCIYVTIEGGTALNFRVETIERGVTDFSYPHVFLADATRHADQLVESLKGLAHG